MTEPYGGAGETTPPDIEDRILHAPEDVRAASTRAFNELREIANSFTDRDRAVGGPQGEGVPTTDDFRFFQQVADDVIPKTAPAAAPEQAQASQDHPGTAATGSNNQLGDTALDALTRVNSTPGAAGPALSDSAGTAGSRPSLGPNLGRLRARAAAGKDQLGDAAHRALNGATSAAATPGAPRNDTGDERTPSFDTQFAAHVQALRNRLATPGSGRNGTESR